MSGSVVVKVGKVNSGKNVYARLVLPPKCLFRLDLKEGDEVFVETRADCIIIKPCHPKEQPDG